jgi:Tol biopolymer transport system component
VQEDRTETLFESPGRNLRGISWSPNRADLAFWRFPGDDATEPELWAYSMESAEARKLFAAPGGLPSLGGCDYCLGFSPDGRWLLYGAVEDGTPQVYLRAYPELGPAIRVSTGGGNDAHWAPDGSTIYYLAPTGSLMAVAVEPAPSRELSAPEVVVDAPEGHALFGVSSDGTRFLRRQGDGFPVLKVITAWQQRAERPDR